MRAHEFTSITTINEILGGSLENPMLPPDRDFSDSDIVDTVDGYEIHVFKYVPYFDIILAVLNTDGTYKGYIGFNNDGHFIEANTKQEYQRKGIMSVLMLYALRNGISPLFINSTDTVSRFSRAVIWSLKEKNKIKVTDKNNIEYSSEQLFNILNDNWPSDYSLYLYSTHGSLSENYWEFRDTLTKEAYYDKNFLGESIEPYWYE